MAKKIIFGFLVLSVIVTKVSAQVTFEQNPFEKAESFKYIPIRGEYWSQIEEYLKNKKYEAIISYTASEPFAKLKNNEKAELYLAVAEAAVRADHPYLGFLLSYEITKVFPLSNQAIRSYYLMEEIIKKTSLQDELIIGETILEQDINLESKKIPADLKSFLGYLFFQSHRQQGFPKWENLAQKWIQSESEWSYRLEYDRALYELFNDRFSASLKIFEQLMNNEKVSDFLRKKAKRQVARLIFENGEFQKSFELLKSLQFEQDDRGFILLERAWTKYYLKHYSKSLGLLTVLDTPLFRATRTPEVDILKMLIYKELCYYGAVFNVKKSFDRRYQKAISDIKNRKNLKSNPEIMRLALMKPDLKNDSMFIGGLRKDFVWYEKIAGSVPLTKDLKAKVQAKDKQLQDVISAKLNEVVRKTADDLLDWSEQVNFLDYQSRVDSLKIKRSEAELNYKPESIPLMTFDRLYWLYKGEMWIDELENFRVLVKSQCQRSN